MKQILFKGLTISLLLSLALIAKSQSLLVENFDYVAGSLLTANGWTAHSGAGTNSIAVSASSISYTGYLSSGIGNEITMTTTGEDVNRSFLSQNSGSLYHSFIVNVTATQTTGDYFAHFATTSGTSVTSFAGRVWVKKDPSSSNFAFGVSKSSTAANISYTGYDYVIGTTYLIVVKHTFVAGATNDVTDLFINPTLNASEPSPTISSLTADNGTADPAQLVSFCLRQGTSTAAPSLKMDGIRVATAWSEIVGSGSSPAISVSPSTLSGFSYIFGAGPSATQFFTVSGSNLSGNISIAATTNYEISLTAGSGYTTPITLTPVGGTVTSIPIYVRLKAGLATGNYTGEIINITSSGAEAKTVTCSGSVVASNEPTNHVTGFTATANSSTAITVSWTDSDATGYLVKGSATSYAAIITPVDGTAEADGALVKNVSAGIGSHQFTGLTASTPYYFKIFPYNGSGALVNYKTDGTVPQATATTQAPPASPTLTEGILPQFIQGNQPTNNDRVPYAFRVTLSNLLPNATYRFTNQVVIATDDATAAGAGNAIYVSQTGTFTRTTGPALSTAGNYGEFTTDAAGTFTGWFITEPTANSRFNPGNEVYMRIRTNDGAGGTTAINILTTTSPIKVIYFGTDASATLGTAIRGVSSATSKNFVFLYDNIAGSGRPLNGSTIENIGINFGVLSSYPTFYRNDVYNTSGSWGSIVPNINNQGVRLIREMNRTDGSIANSHTAADGIWGATNTVNPTGGLASVLVINLVASPTINVNPTTLSGFTYVQGSGPSAAQSFTVSGSNLTGNIIIDASSNYEVSLNPGSGYMTPLSLAPSGGSVTSTTIYVRLSEGLMPGNYNGEIIDLTSSGAEAKTVVCSGTVTTPAIPVINVSTTSLSGFTYVQGNGPSAAQSFAVSGSNLSGNISIAATTNYEISLTAGSGYTTPITLTPVGGTVASTPIYVRLKAGLAAGSYNSEIINITSTGATPKTVACSGTVTPPATPVVNVSTTSLSGFTYVQGSGPSAFQSFSVSGNDLTANINITGPANYEVSLSAGSGYTSSLSLTPSGGTLLSTTIFVRLKAGLAAGNYNAEIINITSAGATSKTVACNGNVVSAQPVNHVIAFTATAVSGSEIRLTWTDSDAAFYLIKGSTVSFTAITSPSDGIAESDGGLVKNVNAGAQQHQFSGLNAGSTYYFKIFPYNGTGINIDYKTDGVVPEASATTPLAPALIEVILPQFIQGINGTNATRIPFAFRVTIENLLPGATYRYINQVVLSTDTPTAGGAGNPIYANQDGTFTRSTSPSLSTAGGYGQFTTNSSGSFTGWFITETTGNANFTPGNNVFMRIRLNNGSNGTTAVHYLTTTSPVKVINFGTESNLNSGTAIRGISQGAPKNFVFLYENPTKNIRPIYGSVIEPIGIDFASNTSYASFYRTDVAGINGAWGGIVPNVNPGGIRTINELSLANASIINSYTSSGGLWGIANTVNPTGGLSSVLVINLVPSPAITVSPTSLSGFTYVQGSGPSAAQSFAVSGNNLSGNISIAASANYEVSLSAGSGYSMLQTLIPTGGTVSSTTIFVRLKAGLASGNYNAEIINITSTGAESKTVACNGTVTQPQLRGDANCDGTVNVLDVITIINFIMEANPTPFCYHNANTNNDSRIDVLDIIETINIIMAGKN